MVASSQGAPFLLNFDERSMAGLMLEGRKAGVENYINENTVFDYAPVGCLENTMAGNDRSGTVDNNLNLLKAVELTLTGGYDMFPLSIPSPARLNPWCVWVPIPATRAPLPPGSSSGRPMPCNPSHRQAQCGTLRKVRVGARSLLPDPLSLCLIKGCAEKGMDITQGGAELNFVTVEAVTYATTVDSLLAIKYLVYDKKVCSMDELIRALKDNWAGHEKLQAIALHKAPKYGRDDDSSDAMGKTVMDLWTKKPGSTRPNLPIASSVPAC